MQNLGVNQADLPKPNWEGIRQSHYGLDTFNNQDDTGIKLPYNPLGAPFSKKFNKTTRVGLNRPTHEKIIKNFLNQKEKDFVDNRSQVYGALSSSKYGLNNKDGGSAIKSISLNNSQKSEEPSLSESAIRRGMIKDFFYYFFIVKKIWFR